MLAKFVYFPVQMDNKMLNAEVKGETATLKTLFAKSQFHIKPQQMLQFLEYNMRVNAHSPVISGCAFDKKDDKKYLCHNNAVKNVFEMLDG